VTIDAVATNRPPSSSGLSGPPCSPGVNDAPPPTVGRSRDGIEQAVVLNAFGIWLDAVGLEEHG
jgi:hypothetical protein